MSLAVVLLTRLQLAYPHRKAVLQCVTQQWALQGASYSCFSHACQSQSLSLLLIPQAGSVLKPAEDLAKEYVVGV